MSNKKMTMVEKYTNTMALLRGEMVEDFSVEDALEFLADRKAKTIAKNTPNPDRKLTPKEKEKIAENEAIFTEIGFVLVGEEKLSIGEMQKKSSVLDGYSNQKLSAMLADMVEVGNVVRIKEKGKTYFALAPANA